MRILYSLVVLLVFNHTVSSQNTIGIITNDSDSYNGYTLFTTQTETYLINNCGQVINQWSSPFPPGNAVYLLENGNLLRAAKIDNPDINFGGTGGRIELFDWDGNLLWEFNYSTSQMRQHHDIYPLPNGNILMLAVSVMDQAESIQAGRNPADLAQNLLYNEQILELEPVGSNAANIVWQWDVKDHLIQDFDAAKDNFGVVEDNPQLLDINFLGGSNGNANWLHANSMQYNDLLDQIVISSRLLNEFYIIDHSTTTAESSSSSGGIYGKGGDFLYRWGNPQVYRQGDSNDQKLFGQHFPHFIQQGLIDEGKIILYNNGFGRTPNFSEIYILDLPTDSEGVYSYTANTAYGPTNPDYIYTDPVISTDFYSSILSSGQRLPNGNILICDGDSGYFFEIDSNDSTVWEYINPLGNAGAMTQGDDPFASGNMTFRAIRYATDYTAFLGRDLTPGNPIELNPDLSNCTILSVDELDLTTFKIYPNPVNTSLTIGFTNVLDKIELYDVFGNHIVSAKNTNTLDLRNLSSGLYILRLYTGNTTLIKKIIKR